MTIKEGNKLIAEFMGDYDLYHWGRDPFNEMVKAKYHKDWNWLMPVVEKIESFQSEGYNTLIEGRNCWIEYNGISFAGSSKDSKIEAVWLAVVEFIKWYNENKDK